MPTENDLEYWVRREAEERQLAAGTRDGASMTHARLADRYAELIMIEKALRALNRTRPAFPQAESDSSGI